MGHEPCYEVNPHSGSDIFYRRLFIGYPTAFPIPMHHYAVDEKTNYKLIRWGSVAE